MVQQNPDGAPFSVDLFGGRVRDGMAGSIFVNDGGVLTMESFEALDVTAMSLVSTANLGTTFVEDVLVSSSSIEVRTLHRLAHLRALRKTAFFADTLLHLSHRRFSQRQTERELILLTQPCKPWRRSWSSSIQTQKVN